MKKRRKSISEKEIKARLDWMNSEELFNKSKERVIDLVMKVRNAIGPDFYKEGGKEFLDEKKEEVVKIVQGILPDLLENMALVFLSNHKKISDRERKLWMTPFEFGWWDFVMDSNSPKEIGWFEPWRGKLESVYEKGFAKCSAFNYDNLEKYLFDLFKRKGYLLRIRQVDEVYDAWKTLTLRLGMALANIEPLTREYLDGFIDFWRVFQRNSAYRNITIPYNCSFKGVDDYYRPINVCKPSRVISTLAYVTEN